SLAPEARLDLDELVRTLVAGGTPAEIIRETDALAETVAAEARSGEDVVVAMSGRDFDGVHGKILAALERGA
ncbi:MAG: UDP-N-acetylmuramate dehydrogenase, partial [Myxococcales bacterium]|nr:UDP-N-acetylmuramate dehydrogenase [Myxococcales bacterium]